MTLEGLIGELLALSHAYPSDTPVAAEWRDMSISEVVGVTAQSDESGVRIVIEAQ